MRALITVRYSCGECQLEDVALAVPARLEDEDVVAWVNQTAKHIERDHAARSSHCRAKAIKDLKIPLEGRAIIGGPSIQ